MLCGFRFDCGFLSTYDIKGTFNPHDKLVIL